MILRFGKYKGSDITEAPSDYIEWLIATQEKTISEYKQELARRRALQDAKLSWAERIVETGFRSLAMQYHPDHGGDGDTMRQIIGTREKLQKLLREAGYW